MGVRVTHYVVVGIVLDDKSQIKIFNKCVEDNFEFFEEYDDNAYQKDISTTPSGIHVIVDGMNGKYIVIGKILDKGLEDGLVRCNINPPNVDVMVEKSKIDKVLEKVGIDSNLVVEYITFAHWH